MKRMGLHRHCPSRVSSVVGLAAFGLSGGFGQLTSAAKSCKKGAVMEKSDKAEQ